MKNSKAKYLTDILLLFLGAIVIVGICGIGVNKQGQVQEQFIQEPEPEATTLEPEQPFPTPDWTLEIPSIGLKTQMVQTYAENKDIQVPDSVPGYFIDNSQNILILGHNSSIFSRLKEIPQSISIYHNNQPTTYNLQTYEDTPNENISMKSVLAYPGVVLMTCSGEYINGHYNKRLILYYK